MMIVENDLVKYDWFLAGASFQFIRIVMNGFPLNMQY